MRNKIFIIIGLCSLGIIPRAYARNSDQIFNEYKATVLNGDFDEGYVMGKQIIASKEKFSKNQLYAAYYETAWYSFTRYDQEQMNENFDIAAALAQELGDSKRYYATKEKQSQFNTILDSVIREYTFFDSNIEKVKYDLGRGLKVLVNIPNGWKHVDDHPTKFTHFMRINSTNPLSYDKIIFRVSTIEDEYKNSPKDVKRVKAPMAIRYSRLLLQEQNDLTTTGLYQLNNGHWVEQNGVHYDPDIKENAEYIRYFRTFDNYILKVACSAYNGDKTSLVKELRKIISSIEFE